METILTFQNSIINGRDIFVIDGIKSEYTHSEEQEKAIRLIRKLESVKPLRLFRVDGTSPAIRVNVDDDNTILISSNFDSVDQQGRKMTFLFYCEKYRNVFWLMSRLRDYCKLANVKVNENDIRTIERSLKIHSKRKIIYASIAIFPFIIFILLIRLFHD